MEEKKVCPKCGSVMRYALGGMFGVSVYSPDMREISRSVTTKYECGSCRHTVTEGETEMDRQKAKPPHLPDGLPHDGAA